MEIQNENEIKQKRKKLVIFFSGTGNDEGSFLKGAGYHSNDVITICVKRCDAPEVCNSVLFPNLEEFSERFASELFNPDGTLNLDLEKLKSIGVSTVCYDAQNIIALDEDTFKKFDEIKDQEENGVFKKIRISSEADFPKTVEIAPDDGHPSILLSGYSRGAVTCAHVAKKLNEKIPETKIDMVMDHPVPGDLTESGANTQGILDCTSLKNLGRVSVILGAYTGREMHYGFEKDEWGEVKVDVEGYATRDKPKDKEKTSWVHRLFFSQAVPELPLSVERHLTVVPVEHHNAFRYNAPLPGGDCAEHLNYEISKFLQQDGLVLQSYVEEKKGKVTEVYRRHGDEETPLYPDLDEVQKIFGLSEKDIYLYLDKLHPAAHLRKGMTMMEGESLAKWWNRVDTGTSPSNLTRDLIQSISSVESNNQSEELLALFSKADQWLLKKQDCVTSRYSQVVALRNNVFDLLVKNHEVTEQKLADQSLKNKHENHYFLRRWQNTVEPLSFFKTSATDTLGRAFLKHAKGEISRENYQELLNALGVWLQGKQPSGSKRYKEVRSIYHHVEKILKDCFQNENKDSNGLVLSI